MRDREREYHEAVARYEAAYERWKNGWHLADVIAYAQAISPSEHREEAALIALRDWDPDPFTLIH